MDYMNSTGFDMSYRHRANAEPANNTDVDVPMEDIWEVLRTQISSFNQIVVIPATWYGNWKIGDKITMQNYMR